MYFADKCRKCRFFKSFPKKSVASLISLSTVALFPEQEYAPGNQRPNDEKCQGRVKRIANFYLQKEDSVVKGKKHTPSGKSYPKCSGGAVGHTRAAFPVNSYSK